MKTERTDKYQILTPKKGMWLFNGSTFSDGVFAPLDADTSIWREVTDKEKERLEKEQVK